LKATITDIDTEKYPIGQISFLIRKSLTFFVDAKTA